MNQNISNRKWLFFVSSLVQICSLCLLIGFAEFIVWFCAFTDLISDMLGSEKYKISWQTVVDSFQDPTINRCV